MATIFSFNQISTSGTFNIRILHHFVPAGYDVDIIPNLTRGDETRTRGHGFKLAVQRTKYNLRKFSFTNRVVNFWNLLPSAIVNANSVISFKTNFDKHMKNKYIYFNYKADTY